MSYSSTAEINAIYLQQQHYKATLKKSSISQRTAWLKQLKQEVLIHEPQIKEALLKDFRKNPIETEVTEVLAVLMELNNICTHLHKWAKQKKVKSSLLFTTVRGTLHYEPKGTTLIITPWNYPFQLPMVNLMASIAAGNSIILKLSEHAPHINKIIKKILQHIFTPQHVFVTEGAIEETTHLLSLKFDHIHFTGSPSVGKIIMSAAARHLTDVTLELGGKSPTFVDRDINIKEVVRNIIWAKFVNMGQTCIAPDYLLVDKSIAPLFEQAIKEEIYHAFGTNPEHSNDLARIINKKQYHRLQQALEQLKSTDTNWIIEGKNNEDTLYIAPTIIKNMPLDSQIMLDEIFGPILPIIYYNKIQEAFDLVASKEKPLALYIFSKDKSYIQNVLEHTTSGGTTINDAMVHILHPNLPFGGINNSGIGQSTGYFGFKSFSHERSIAQARIQPMTKFFWFPYNDKTKKFINWIRKLI